jgi:CheY-like chemotaxis protein/anti-sigma regulatory factor (Ser/Thr protein kinase)
MTTQRILIADDEPHIRKVITDVLRKEGSYRVEAAEDGAAALAFLEAEGFDWDLVITDMMMPQMNGYELIRTLHERAPRIATVVLTAHKDDENVLQCLEAGACDYLLKPISVSRMLQTVRHALERQERFQSDEDGMQVQQQAAGWVEITAPSDFEYVERFRRFTSLLGDAPLSQEEKEDLRVAIDELGQNAIEWGNRQDRNKRIHLSYCIFHDRIVFKVEDEGEGFDPGSLNDPSVDPLQHILDRMQAGKRAGGYGVFITRKLMDDIVYNEKGNVAILTKLFTHAGEGAAPNG